MKLDRDELTRISSTQQAWIGASVVLVLLALGQLVLLERLDDVELLVPIGALAGPVAFVNRSPRAAALIAMGCAAHDASSHDPLRQPTASATLDRVGQLTVIAVRRAVAASVVGDAGPKDLGLVLDAVQATLPKETLFLFSSDHGAQWPFAKWSLYDAGIHQPFIAAWPGVIRPGDAVERAFAAVGWGWGGDFGSAKDWQHFSASGR